MVEMLEMIKKELSIDSKILFLLKKIYIYIYICKMMMPKHSPVRYTIFTLEQPVPENKKVQRKAF